MVRLTFICYQNYTFIIFINLYIFLNSGVWTADTSKQQANLEIGRKLKEQLGIHGKIGFQLHRDTMVKHSSATKNLYTV